MQIFRYLPGRDLWNVTKVCTQWNVITSCKIIWKNVFVDVGSYNEEYRRWIIERGIKSYNIMYDFDHRMFGPFVERIRCEHIVWRRKHFFFCRVCNLDSINHLIMDDCKILNDASMLKIVQNMPNIVTLTLKNARYLWRIIHLLPKLKRLKVLNIEWGMVSNMKLRRFLQTSCARELMSLRLINLCIVTMEILPEIVTMCPTLQRLELSYRPNFNYCTFESAMKNISSNLKIVQFYVLSELEENLLRMFMNSYLLDSNKSPNIEVNVFYSSNKKIVNIYRAKN